MNGMAPGGRPAAPERRFHPSNWRFILLLPSRARDGRAPAFGNTPSKYKAQTPLAGINPEITLTRQLRVRRGRKGKSARRRPWGSAGRKGRAEQAASRSHNPRSSDSLTLAAGRKLTPRRRIRDAGTERRRRPSRIEPPSPYPNGRSRSLGCGADPFLGNGRIAASAGRFARSPPVTTFSEASKIVL